MKSVKELQLPDEENIFRIMPFGCQWCSGQDSQVIWMEKIILTIITNMTNYNQRIANEMIK